MITMIIIHVMITPRQRLRLRSHDNRLNYEQIHAVHSRRRTLRNNNTNNNTDNNTYIIYDIIQIYRYTHDVNIYHMI